LCVLWIGALKGLCQVRPHLVAPGVYLCMRHLVCTACMHARTHARTHTHTHTLSLSLSLSLSLTHTHTHTHTHAHWLVQDGTTRVPLLSKIIALCGAGESRSSAQSISAPGLPDDSQHLPV
jgi:hypothetical protein